MIDSTPIRFSLILAAALAAHVAVLLIRGLSRRILKSRMHSEAKLRTVTGFTTSVLIFGIYFAAIGFVLAEVGVSLTTYFASASVIGLAVSFGSQGVVQDVITGLTVVTSDLLDVGDLVDIGGQVGIVESVGMRFTVLVNFSGAHVFVPNRSIMSVINHPNGYSRAYMDVRLPAEAEKRDEAERQLAALSQSAYEQFPGVLLVRPTVESSVKVHGGYDFLRIKFRIWPGQGAVLERTVASAAAKAMKDLDPSYADWMVTVHYRSEPPSAELHKRLPRPSVLVRRERAAKTPKS